jgi:hypothetical protein
MADKCAMLYSMTTKTRTNLSGVPALAATRTEFDCNGTLEGVHSPRYMPYVGRLPQEYHHDLSRACQFSDFYYVRSYATPIAWFANGEWTVPDVKYSPTTSRHQSTVKRGIHA